MAVPKKELCEELSKFIRVCEYSIKRQKENKTEYQYQKRSIV